MLRIRGNLALLSGRDGWLDWLSPLPWRHPWLDPASRVYHFIVICPRMSPAASWVPEPESILFTSQHESLSPLSGSRCGNPATCSSFEEYPAAPFGVTWSLAYHIIRRYTIPRGSGPGFVLVLGDLREE